LPGALVAEDAVIGGEPGDMLRRARRPVNKQPQFRARAQFYLPPFALTVLAGLAARRA
jgi:hypothetical protein